jgi:hypothetical protein
MACRRPAGTVTACASKSGENKKIFLFFCIRRLIFYYCKFFGDILAYFCYMHALGLLREPTLLEAQA